MKCGFKVGYFLIATILLVTTIPANSNALLISRTAPLYSTTVTPTCPSGSVYMPYAGTCVDTSSGESTGVPIFEYGEFEWVWYKSNTWELLLTIPSSTLSGEDEYTFYTYSLGFVDGEWGDYAPEEIPDTFETYLEFDGFDIPDLDIRDVENDSSYFLPIIAIAPVSQFSEPVPEPSTIVLLGVGLAGLLVFVNTKKSKRA